MKLMLDTNVVIDGLQDRGAFAQDARLLLTAGKVGEFELWISATQITDMLYILSNGQKKDRVDKAAQAVDGILDFVCVYASGKEEIRKAIRSKWQDREDSLINVVAEKIMADAIITGNVKDFEKSLIPVYNSTEFFEWMKATHGMDYGEVLL